MKRRFSGILGSLIFVCAGIPAFALESGQVIPCGTPDGRGPLSTHAVICEPIGVARVSGASEPDVFIQTGRFGREPGVFLYPFSGRGAHGEPVFKSGISVAVPVDAANPPAGHVFRDSQGAIHGLWLHKGGVLHALFDKAAMCFAEAGRIELKGLPHSPGALAVLPNSGDGFEVLLQVGDGVAYSQANASRRSADFHPYNGRGLWQGGLPYVGLYALTLPKGFEGAAENARRISASDREARFQYAGITPVDLGAGHERDILTGSHYGSFYFYRNTAGNGLALDTWRYAVGADGVALRHPTIHPAPVAYPNAEGRYSDFIAAGEGGAYWYRFTGRFTDGGNPVYDAPLPVLEEGALLYAGTLPVPNVVDWDGDGDQDVVAGNSEGFILFFENCGDNSSPDFLPGVRLEAGGQEIHVQSGYGANIQGPTEARWGYVCPTVVDWNRDGRLDIVMSDSTSRHTLFLNIGEKTAPRLAAGVPIYYDGLELYGTWRVQPAAGVLGDRMAYIALDEDDEFHLYWQVDVRNVTDGGKLRLDTGAAIRANYLDAGGTGRLKLVLYDWDRDGAKDLIVGTPRHASVPDPEKGLPQSLGKPGSAILFLKNTGSDATPVFAFPELFAFRGAPIYLGQHACGPAVADFGNPAGPDLIVGEEAGRFLYYSRADLTTRSPESKLN